MSNEICVAMCVYNAAATLRQALDSLKAQTFADFDLVVVDDGSTDGSAANSGSGTGAALLMPAQPACPAADARSR